MLEDHAEAERARSDGRRDRDGLAIEEDFSGIGLDDAVEDLHQRRLARAVFAQERVNLAPLD